jgi:hypothetical protein
MHTYKLNQIAKKKECYGDVHKQELEMSSNELESLNNGGEPYHQHDKESTTNMSLCKEH